jgi:hypothetical protein
LSTNLQYRMQELNKSNIVAIIICLLLLIGINTNVYAQYEDTSSWKLNKVKGVESWVNFLQFENSNDTCLYELKKINEAGKMTFLRQDYKCHGWQMVAETRFEYDVQGRLTLINIIQNDNLMSNTKWWYDEAGRVVKEESKYTEPYALILVSNVYFGPEDSPDSMLSIRVTNGDTIIYRSHFQYRNGDLAREDVVDITNAQPISSHSMQYDSMHRMIRDKMIMMQSYDEDEITNIEYNAEGWISRSQSEINTTAAEFYYHKNGLVAKTFYYNKFETMERQVWHKYTFWE